MKKFTFWCLMFLVSIGAVRAEDELHYGWKRLLPNITYDVGVNPYNYNTIVAGGMGRQFFKSTDGGNTWNSDFIFTQSGRSIFNNIAISHLDTNVILMGGINLVDLYRSTDMGNSWKIVNKLEQNVYMNGKCLYEALDDPGHFYYAGYSNGVIYESKDNGASWDSLSFVELLGKVPNDDGTFTEMMIRQQPTCLGIRPDSTNILLSGNLSGIVMISNDKGKTWKYADKLREPSESPAMASNEVTMFYFNNVDPRRVYAVVTYTVAGDTPNGGLWRSDDGGYNWRTFAFPDTSFWGVACRTLENGEEEIFVGGYNADPQIADVECVPGNKVVRGSFDSGKTWWVFDDIIDWADPNAVLRRVKNFDGRYTACGQYGFFQSTAGTANDWMENNFYRRDININDFININKYEYILVGNNGKIFTNYEQEYVWDSLKSNVDTELHSITQIGNLSFLVVGEDGTILTSRNNMYVWKKQDAGITNDLYTVKNFNGNIFAVGEDGIILNSKDEANTWTSKIVGNNTIYDIDFADDLNGIFVGGPGNAYKTTDGGETWTKMTSLTTNDSLFGITFYDQNNAIITGNHSLVLSTKDGGATWNKLDVGISQNFKHAAFLNADSAIVIGSSETIIKAYPQTLTTKVSRSCYGPVANVWSLRYFGDKGKEKLYMATEAGLFVLEDFNQSIVEITREDPTGNLNLVFKNDVLTVAYRRAFQNQRNPLSMRIVDVSGNEVFKKDYSAVGFENIMDNIELRNLANGAYIVEYSEKNVKSVKKFIKN